MLPKTLKSAAVLACGALVVAGLSIGLMQHTAPDADAAPDTAAQLAGKDAPPLHSYGGHPDFLVKLHQVLITFVRGLHAQVSDKKDDKPSLTGTWGLKGGELTIEFADKGVMKIAPHGNDVLVIICSYTVDKEGQVKAKVTDFEGKDEAKEKLKTHLPVGTEFRFTWKGKDKAAALSDLKGDDVEILKKHLEGDYEEKK